MKLSLGPVLFYWDKAQLGNFYAEMSALPLDVIYLGETVFETPGVLPGSVAGVGARAASVQPGTDCVVEPDADRGGLELSSLRRLCDNGQLLVEANDMGAVQFMAERKLPSSVARH